MRFENLASIKMGLLLDFPSDPLGELTVLFITVLKGKGIIAFDWLKPSPKMLEMCSHKLRFESLKCINMCLRPWLTTFPQIRSSV